MKKEKTGKWLLRKLKWHPFSAVHTMMVLACFCYGLFLGAKLTSLIVVCLLLSVFSVLFYFGEWLFAGLYGED